MTTLQILLVEDDGSNIELWDSAIDLHNSDVEQHHVLINTIYAKSSQEAMEALDAFRVDAAVVDIRLQVPNGAAGHNADGNDFIKRAAVSRPIGIVVYTGQAPEADVGEYPQIQVMDRGEGLAQVINWLVANSKMFAALRSVRDTFDKLTANLFFRSIWPRWSYWANQHEEGVLHREIARHAIAHTHDAMLLETEDGTHPEETYFVPSLRPRLDTGDLVEIDGSVWIVLTPRCDLAREVNVGSIVLVRCEDVGARWIELKENDSNGAKKELATYPKHKGSPKQHFLPPMRIDADRWRGPWMAQFHDLKVETPSGENLERLIRLRFASLAPQFVPSLVERFGNYFSRIGTPDIQY